MREIQMNRERTSTAWEDNLAIYSITNAWVFAQAYFPAIGDLR